jgi:hypothetical protein
MFAHPLTFLYLIWQKQTLEKKQKKGRVFSMLMIHDIPTPLNFFFCYQRNHPALTKKEKKRKGI